MSGLFYFSVLCLLIQGLQIQSAKADPRFIRIQNQMHARALRHGYSVDMDQRVAPLQLDQVIDHFAAPGTDAAKATFKQNYFVSSAYAKGTDSPVILYLCGEGPCEGSTSVPEVNQIAQKYGAYRVALEHRYYGTSQPFTNMETQNMKYLSMDQAIEDLAYFENFLKAKLGLTGKWIVVGGSYAGELSAYYRLKHPELVVGSLASSGPVLAKADFFEYDQHNAQVISSACLAAIKAVTADVESKLTDPAATKAVKALFSSSDIYDNTDFLYVVADMAAGAIQYGMQDSFCDAITNPGSQTATQAYADAGVKVLAALGSTPFQDWAEVAESTAIADEAVGMRGWLYQSCTEFGYYQVANKNAAESARSQQITVAYHDSICKRLFNIDKSVDVDVTNKKFFNHLSDASTTNIFFTNGSNDPWSTLSLSESSATATKNPGLKFFTITGSAHCDDLGSRMSDALTTARNEFLTLAGDWLSN